jgi:hypothetical protein
MRALGFRDQAPCLFCSVGIDGQRPITMDGHRRPRPILVHGNPGPGPKHGLARERGALSRIQKAMDCFTKLVWTGFGMHSKQTEILFCFLNVISELIL